MNDRDIPAFPQLGVSMSTRLDESRGRFIDTEHLFTNAGMSMRDYFAGQALASYIDEEGNPYQPSEVAEWCYSIADAMLKERAQS